MDTVIEFAAPPEAKQALDQKGESDEWPSLSLSGRSVPGNVVAVLLVVFYTLFLAASLLVPIAAAVLLSMLLERARVPHAVRRMGTGGYRALATPRSE
jgi:hypothetical protein